MFAPLICLDVGLGLIGGLAALDKAGKGAPPWDPKCDYCGTSEGYRECKNCGATKTTRQAVLPEEK